MSPLDEDAVEVLRPLLITAMSEYSEDRWAAGWMGGLERELWLEGGKWRLIGGLLGWPDEGTRGRGAWLTADEADAKFGRPE